MPPTAIHPGEHLAEELKELGMSAVAVRQAKSRVLRRLRQELGDLSDGNDDQEEG